MNDLYRSMFLPDLLDRRARTQPRPAGRLHRRRGAHRRALPRRDQPLRAGLPRPRHRAGRRCGDAVEEPPRGALFDGRGDDRRVSQHAVASARLARRPRVRRRGRRRSSTLIFDPSFAERARRAARAGARPEAPAVATGRPTSSVDLVALAATFEPAAARRADGRRRGPVGARLHGRHDRQAQGRDEHVPRQRHHDPDPDGGVAVARRGPPPDLHAAQPRRRGVLRPDAPARRLDASCCRRSSRARCSRRSRRTRSPPRCSCRR